MPCAETSDSATPSELTRWRIISTALLDPQGASGWYVTLDFDGEGTTKFGAMTTRLTSLPSPQNQAAIVLDGLVYSAPRINEPINTGTAQITGNFTQLEAQDLSNVLKYGALPLTFDRGEVQQVSPSLGADQLRGGLIAGVLGLLLVIVYSMLYYRGLGIVSVRPNVNAKPRTPPTAKK